MSPNSALHLAPSAIKNLAKRLRAQGIRPMSVSQSQEILSRVLGHCSWHAAHRAQKACPSLKSAIIPGEAFSVERRRRFYRQIRMIVSCGIPVPVVQALEVCIEASVRWELPPDEMLLFERVHASMVTGLEFSKALEHVLEGLPVGLEILMVQSAPNLADGLEKAWEMTR